MLDAVPHCEVEEVKEYRCFLSNLYEWVITKEQDGADNLPSGSLRRYAKIWRKYLGSMPSLLSRRELMVIDRCLRYACLPNDKGFRPLKFKRAKWAVLKALRQN